MNQLFRFAHRGISLCGLILVIASFGNSARADSLEHKEAKFASGVLANVDGELFEQTKLDLKVWPDALRVVVPRGLLL